MSAILVCFCQNMSKFYVRLMYFVSHFQLHKVDNYASWIKDGDDITLMGQR